MVRNKKRRLKLKWRNYKEIKRVINVYVNKE